MDARSDLSRDRTGSGVAIDEAGWRLWVKPEAVCLVVGMIAALFLTWTLQPGSSWESLLETSGWLLGPGAVALLAYLPDAVGVAALLIVVGGAAKVVTSTGGR